MHYIVIVCSVIFSFAVKLNVFFFFFLLKYCETQSGPYIRVKNVNNALLAKMKSGPLNITKVWLSSFCQALTTVVFSCCCLFVGYIYCSAEHWSNSVVCSCCCFYARMMEIRYFPA